MTDNADRLTRPYEVADKRDRTFVDSKLVRVDRAARQEERVVVIDRRFRYRSVDIEGAGLFEALLRAWI